ncbi:MAG TPA: arginine repressor [Gemmatimonadales bacterium]|nr:arginine repressor [Gemmatimonadales bacterium]
MSTDRRQRHLKILELISTSELRTQEEVAAALADAGWKVTQSSVSRDIAALRLVKVNGAYRRPVVVARPSDDPDLRRIAEALIGVDTAGDALVVLRTPPGEASPVGAALDRLAWAGVVGTIAGDDTILVAVSDAAAQRAVMRELRKVAALR